MFKIVDVFGEPVRLPPYGCNLDLGNIVSITTINGELFFTLSTSRNPFGVAVGSDDYTGLVSAYCGLVIFQTDKFEVDQNYNKGDLLYSSDGGVFTTRKTSESSIPLGLVNDERLDETDYIEGRLI